MIRERSTGTCNWCCVVALSEVLDADTVEWFKQNGGLSRKNGDWFRRQVLSRGGSVDAIGAFTRFRDHAPDINPLLVRRGLDAAAAK